MLFFPQVLHWPA